MNVIILHGIDTKKRYLNPNKPSASNSHWLPWLQKQVLASGHKADTPEVFKPYHFKYADWVKEIERFDINEETVFVGHSMGAGCMFRYLNESKNIKIAKLILVAPWLNVGRVVDTDFFDFEIDKNLSDRITEIVIFNSKDDSENIQQTVELIKNRTMARVIEFEDKGHFTMKKMGGVEFLELLNEIV